MTRLVTLWFSLTLAVATLVGCTTSVEPEVENTARTEAAYAVGDCAAARSSGMGYGTYWCGASGGGCNSTWNGDNNNYQQSNSHVIITVTNGVESCRDAVTAQ